MSVWTMADAPWLAHANAGYVRESLGKIRALDPSAVLSSHLPPASDVERLLRCFANASQGQPFRGPDQHALEAMLAASQSDG